MAYNIISKDRCKILKTIDTAFCFDIKIVPEGRG